MPKSAFTKLISDAVIVVLITVVLLIFVEVALRVLPIDINTEEVIFPTELLSSGRAFEFHPDYLIKLKANQKKSFKHEEQNGGKEVVWHTNSLGFRGPEFRDSPELRVVVYGDSNIQARFSDYKDSFPARLAVELTGALKKDVEVINGGIIGFGPDQSYLKFMEEAETLKPDLVIMHLFADNDYGDVIRNRLFDLGPDGKLVKTAHKRVPDIVIADRGFLSKFAITRFIKSKKTKRQQRSYQKDIPTNMKKALDEFEVFTYGRAREYSHFDDRYDGLVSFKPDSKSAQVQVALVEEILKEAGSFARGKDIRFMVLVQPSMLDMTENETPNNYKEFAVFPQYRPTNLSGFAEAVLERNSISGLNLYDVFYRNNPDDLFFTYKNDHWNDRGQALAARETAAYIIKNAILE